MRTSGPILAPCGRLTKVLPEGIFESFSIIAHQELYTSLSSTDAKLTGVSRGGLEKWW